MKREAFVRLSYAVLTRRGMAAAEAAAHTEAIASAIDLLEIVTGDAPAERSAAAPPASPAPAAFPAPPQESVFLLGDPTHGQALQAPQQPLIVAPGDVRGALAKAPPPIVIPAVEKTEQLSQAVQERTPPFLHLNVPLPSGGVSGVTFERNVISMHAFESVKLVYYPQHASASARESMEVSTSIALADLPLDLAPTLELLKAEAIRSLIPRSAPQSVMPAPAAGPVKHAQDSYVDPGLQAQTQAIFNGLG